MTGFIAGIVTGIWLMQTGGQLGDGANFAPSYWRSEDGSVIELRACGQELCGYLASKIISSETPPNDSTASACGLPILLGLKPDGKNKWHGGWVVDPDTGWAFNAKLKLTKKGTIKLSAYQKLEILSQSFTWTPAARSDADCTRKNKP